MLKKRDRLPEAKIMIEIIDADDKQLRDDFIDIPYHLYPKSSFWVPPLKKVVFRKESILERKPIQAVYSHRKW